LIQFQLLLILTRAVIVFAVFDACQ